MRCPSIDPDDTDGEADPERIRRKLEVGLDLVLAEEGAKPLGRWPMMAEVLAPAKINLTLHVTGQRADGYHLLDSLVVFADIGDRIAVRPADRTGS